MASIQKRIRKDGTSSYRVEVRIKGQPPARATFTRLTDAKRWAQQTEAAIRERRYFRVAEAEKHTLAELIDRYLKDYARTKNDRQRLLWWREQLGYCLLADLTPARITEGRDRLRNRSPATVNRYLSALSHALTIATRDYGWLDDSPMRKVTRMKEPRGRVRFLSDDERERLLQACLDEDPKLYLFVVLLLSTGMRHGEAMGLKWQDVDLVAGRITLHDTKNGERRVAPLVGKARELLREHAKVRPIESPLVFHAVKNRFRTPWEKALKRAGIEDFRFHDLRHTAASYLAMNGATMAEIAEVLGHKTLAMVKRYAHLSEAHTTSVVERMNARMFGE